MTTAEDHKKYIYALGSRTIRRAAFKVDEAEMDHELRAALMRDLDMATLWLKAAAFFDRLPRVDGGDGESEADLTNWEVYSDGRLVSNQIEWHGRYSTLVHRPDPSVVDMEDGEMQPELCPCCQQHAGDDLTLIKLVRTVAPDFGEGFGEVVG
jgi:hypothetical protein